jgi:type IV secretory pathway VirB10-like protein
MLRPTPPLLRLAALLMACCLVLPAQAQWKWRDKDGRITASDLPPPRDVLDKDIIDRPAEVRRPPARPASAASAPRPAVKGPLEREVDARRLATEQQQAAKAKVEDERLRSQRAENCRRARSHLAALESGQRIARMNDKGEREVIDDRTRADEQRQAREVIASDCR